MGVRVATYLSDRLCTVVVRSDTMGTSYVVQCFLAFACEVDAFPCLCSARVSGGLLPFFTFSFFWRDYGSGQDWRIVVGALRWME